MRCTRALPRPCDPVAIGVLVFGLLFGAVGGASAQVNRPAPTAPSAVTDQSGSTSIAMEPMTVANVVHRWAVLGVSDEGALVVDANGVQTELELEPIAIPPATDPTGANARRYLHSLVGRELQFWFREHEDRGAAGAHLPPSRRAYADAVAHMVRRGLARYCPEAGVRMLQLERFEQEAKARSLGLWSAAAPLRCPEP